MSANREDVVCTLLAARCLISDPEDWTQGANARTADGVLVGAKHDAAVCWCAEGAIIAVAPSDIGGNCIDLVDEAWHALAVATCGGATLGPITVNDQRGHAATLAMFDRAIELAAA